MSRYIFLFYTLIMLLSFPLAACANRTEADRFQLWLKQLEEQARAQGVKEHTLQDIFSGLTPNPTVIALDRKQPEKTKGFRQYKAGVVAESRVKEARRLYRQHYALLHEIGAHYGVQPRFIVSLWGIETSFGANMGNFNVTRSLATLAFDGRRSDFFRGELLQLLTIMEKNHLANSAVKGSWAGAMGQTQFMPSSYNKFAVDYNHDGFADIWHTKADVFASIANYLAKTGWDNNTGWGRKVQLPPNFDTALTGMEQRKALNEWSRLGVKTADGHMLPAKAIAASLIILDNNPHEAYIVYNNYRVLLDWNKSKYFATAVGLLADKIAQE